MLARAPLSDSDLTRLAIANNAVTLTKYQRSKYIRLAQQADYHHPSYVYEYQAPPPSAAVIEPPPPPPPPNCFNQIDLERKIRERETTFLRFVATQSINLETSKQNK